MSIRGLVDGALEASVVGSFTRLGYDARRRLYSWTPLEQLQLDGKTAIVTGATSGLGQETATPARSTRGARLRRRARSRPHRERATIATGRGVRRSSTSRRSPRRTRSPESFAASHDRLDVLVLNAGAMTHEFTRHGRGLRADPRDAGALAVPADPRSAAAARGGPVRPRDHRRVRRDVPRAPRRRTLCSRARRTTTASRPTRVPSARRWRSPRSGRAISPARG